MPTSVSLWASNGLHVSKERRSIRKGASLFLCACASTGRSGSAGRRGGVARRRRVSGRMRVPGRMRVWVCVGRGGGGAACRRGCAFRGGMELGGGVGWRGAGERGVGRRCRASFADGRRECAAGCSGAEVPGGLPAWLRVPGRVCVGGSECVGGEGSGGGCLPAKVLGGVLPGTVCRVV